MDIYNAEIQVNKLLNYVKSLSDAKPRMYQKSKDRLKELASTCNQVVSIIAEILQDETLLNDQDEFGGANVNDFNSVLNSMEDQISELRQFLSVPRTTTPTSDSTSNSAKKQAMSVYKQCLSSTAQSDIPVVEAEDCSKLLWCWFNARFLESSGTFKYNIKRIPGWIRDIVVLYSYHFEVDTLDSFKSSFYTWIASIANGNNYAVPYEIYTFDKNPDASKLTLTSAVIWDILLDYGLKNLCNNSSDLYPSEDCVISLVETLNSSIIDPYKHYMYDHSILEQCRLTLKMKGGDI